VIPEHAVARNDRPIFLIGFMGSGKSAVGRLVAERLGRDFVDTDDLVVEREGRSIERIFREVGEAEFRRLEWEALQSLEGRRQCVAATGGGLFLGFFQRSWLREHGITVWLDAPFSACLRRVGPGAGRPLWTAGKDPEAFRALFEKRRAAYALAAVRVGAAGSVAETARDVLSRLTSISP
jgi:shikimate kinase